MEALGMLWWTIAIGLAFLVAIVAEDRGQPPLPWFVVAVFLPVISLLVLLAVSALRPTPADAPPGPIAPPTADDAVAASAVARALADAPARSSVHQLVQRTGLDEAEVLAQLRALTRLGRVHRDDTGRFELTAARPGPAPAGP